MSAVPPSPKVKPHPPTGLISLTDRTLQKGTKGSVETSAASPAARRFRALWAPGSIASLGPNSFRPDGLFPGPPVIGEFRSIISAEMGTDYGGCEQEITLSNGIMHAVDSFLRLPVSVSATGDEMRLVPFMNVLQGSKLDSLLNWHPLTTVFVPERCSRICPSAASSSILWRVSSAPHPVEDGH